MTSPSIIGLQLRRIGKAALRLTSAEENTKEKRFPFRSTGFLMTVLCTISVLSIGTVYFSIPEKALTFNPKQTLTSISVRLPDLRGQMAFLESRNEIARHDLIIGNSETLSSLLARLGVRDPSVKEFIVHNPDATALVYPTPKQFVTASVREDGSLVFLKMFSDTKSGTKKIEILSTGEANTFRCSVSPFKYDVQYAMINGQVHGSPELSLQKSSIPSSVIAQMHKAFDYDNDIVTHLKDGDSFRVIYEANYAAGSFVRFGRLLAMQFDQKGKTTELFWFGETDGSGDYYDAKGRLAKRTFMRVPLDVKSVSSEFAPMRRHPITGVLRPHRGTDFRAPWGATVRAAADGKVIFAGNGTGYGKYIKLQHGPDCITLYAHLSSIANNLTYGQEVKRGDIIGRVGQTGLATGPHLHYELVIDGVQINPMTAELPDTPVLTPYKFAQLQARIAPLREKLNLMRRIQVVHSDKNIGT